MIEHHPYGHYIPRGARAVIIGSFPIAKFSNPRRRHEIKPHEFDFFFGGEKNLLWKLMGEVFQVPLRTRSDIIAFLKKQGLGLGDIISSCRRKHGGSSDSDLYDITWKLELIKILKQKKIQRIYFTSRQVEKWFIRLFPGPHDWESILLISPSAQSARSIVRRPDYQDWKGHHPQSRTYEYLLMRYREAFGPFLR